ncbi:MAG: hypothetical protein OXD54_06215 [Candidatus Poribacteria bacterium]|nr:hypothetical protein [Candidatus Poribacteria bacterium]
MYYTKNLDESDPPQTSYKYIWLTPQTIIYISLFIVLFQIVGCGPLGITDPQTDAPFSKPQDSKQIKKWQIKRTLVSNEVNCIAADSENVWFATNKGVSRWIRNKDKWLHYTMEDGLANDLVNAVAIDGKWVWFATQEGVSRYDMDTDTFSTFRSIDGLASDQVSSIAVDGNYVWFGTSNGLNRYDKTIDSWAVRTRKDGLISRIITTIAVEPEYVWVGTDREINPDPHGWDDDPRFSKGGVSRYHRDTDSWNNYTKSDGLIDNEIATIAVDDDSVWLGTQHRGVSQYNQVDQTFVKTYTKSDLLKSNVISSIRSDGFQVWFGTANAGVHRYIKPVNTWVHYTKIDGLASNNISWITTQGNDVWFASKEDGVSRFDKVSGEWIIYKQADFLADNDVRDIERDADGNLWMATVSGLSVYSPKTHSWEIISREDGLPTNYIMSVDVVTPSYETESNTLSEISNTKINSPRIWIGTARGLGSCTHLGGDWNFHLSSESETFVTAVATDTVSTSSYGESQIWLGTNLGPAMFDTKQQKWTQLVLPDTTITPHILSVHIHDSNVWFGGINGIWKYSITEKQMYDVSDGLIDLSVNTLTSVNDSVWAGTQKGLAKYDATQQCWIPIPLEKNSDKHKTQPSITALAYHDDVLWIGTPQGLGSYTVSTKKWNPPKKSKNIRDVVCNENGKLWLATSMGLVEYNISNGNEDIHQSRPVRQPLVETQVSQIMFDGDYIWFSNWRSSRNGGILRFHRPTKTWLRFTRFDIFKSTLKKTMTVLRWTFVDKDAVWFTTDFGVLRFDKEKETWQHYTMKDGLSSDDLDKISVSDKSVWIIAMTGMELNRFDKETATWEIVKQPERRDEHERLRGLAVDGSEVWFGSGHSLTRYNENTKEWKEFRPSDGLAGRGCEWITIDKDFVWVARSEYDRGSNRPLSRYDKKTKEWSTFSTNDVLAAKTIKRIIATENDVWIQYRPWDNVVTRYDRLNKEWTTITSGRGTLELAADDDYLWLAAPNEGLRRFHFASGSWTTFKDIKGLLHNHVGEYALAVDKDYVWVGTIRGLSRYDKHRESWTPFPPLPTLSGRTVRTVDTDQRFVWVGTDNGLSRYDKKIGTWKNYKQTGGSEEIATHNGHWHRHRPKSRGMLSDNAVSSIVVDEQYVWVGTRDGVNRFDKIALRWDQYKTEHGLPSNNVTSVSTDDNNIWVGTNSGIGKYPRTADDLNAWIAYISGTEIQPSTVSKEFAESLVTDEIWCITASKKFVWVGTRRGVSKYDIRRDIWKTITSEDGLASDEVSCIAIDGERVWFGSDRGVTLFNERTQDWRVYTTQDGLASDKVTTIGVDGTDVWIGTYNAGISRFNHYDDSWKTYTRKDGLAHNGILSMSIDSDYVWFGTYRGLSRFDKRTGIWTTFTEAYGPEDILR